MVVRLREGDRDVGGSRMLEYSGGLDRDGQPNDDFGAAQLLNTLSTQGIHTYLRTTGHIENNVRYTEKLRYISGDILVQLKYCQIYQNFETYLVR